MTKYYIGLDVSKSFHVCYVIDENEKVVGNIKFDNDKNGFEKFFDLITSIDNNLNNFSVALEATGIYFENLFLFLKNKFDKLFLINPFVSNKFREFSNMNKAKTDNIDALLLALMISKNKFSSSYLSKDELAEIKFLNRYKLEKQKLLKNYKKELSDVLIVVFPEYTKVIKNIFSKTSLTLLKLYPTAFHFQKLTPKKIVKKFRNIKGNNFNETKAKELIKFAKETIYQGNAYEVRTYIIRDLIENIEKLQQDISDIENSLKDIIENAFNFNKNTKNYNNSYNKNNNISDNNFNNLNSVIENLRSIPGVSDKTIITVLSECGDLNRFKNVSKFIGYIGYFPEIHQSGKYQINKSLTKKGNKKVKTAFYQVAVASILHNSELKKIYNDNVSKGKSKKESLIIVAIRLAKIFYSIYKHNTPYNPERVFKSDNLIKN